MLSFLLISVSVSAARTVFRETNGELTGETWSAISAGVNGGAVNAWGTKDTPITLVCTQCNFSGVSGTGGGAVCCAYGAVSMQNCIFNNCQDTGSGSERGGGAILLKSSSLTAHLCQFSGCLSLVGEGGTVCARPPTTPVDPTHLEVKLDDCDIVGAGEKSVLYLSGLALVNLTGNEVRSDQKHTSPVLQSDSEELVFDWNHFTLSVDRCAIQIDRCQPQLAMSHCEFNNGGEKLTGSQYIMLGQSPSRLSFDSCSFDNMQSAAWTPAFQLGTDSAPLSLLVVTFCNFTRLSCDGSGGAIHTQHTSAVELHNCTFDSCSCKAGDMQPERGGGAVYLEFHCERADISGCVFNNNSSPQKGRSLQVPFTNNLNGLNLRECIFQGHQTGSVICFEFFEGDPGTPSTYRQKHTISMCQFVSNVVRATGDDGSYGLVQMKSSVGIEYYKCVFQGNEQAESGRGIISVSNLARVSGTPYCHFIECDFLECNTEAVSDNTPVGGVLFLGESCAVGDVVVRDCFVRGGSSTFIRISSNADTVSISGSEFDACEFHKNGFIDILSGAGFLVGKFSISGCSFSSCSSSAGSTLFRINNGTCTSILIEENLFDSCTGGGTIGLFNLTSVDFQFRSNNVSFSDGNAEYVCAFGLHDEKEELVIEGDRFSGLGTTFARARFINVTEIHKQVSFVGCIFENVTSNLGGVSFRIKVDTLNVLGCIFHDLSCANNGGAIHSGRSKRLTAENCSIYSCSANAGGGGDGDGGGGLYLEYELEYASIEGCVFTNNRCSRNGQSIQVPFTGTVDGLTIFNCTFKEHAGSSIICFTFTQAGANFIYGHMYEITGCIFDGNNVNSGEFGLVESKSSVGITYRNCSFVDNINPLGGAIVLESLGNTSLVLDTCVFEQSGRVTGTIGQHLVLIKPELSLAEFRLQYCSFIGIRTDSHLLGFAASNLRSVEGFMAKTMEVSYCSFVNSDSTSPTDAFILVKSPTFNIKGNVFAVETEIVGRSVLEIHVVGTGSIVEDTAFSVLGSDYSAPLLTLSSDEGSQLQFYNCCFTHPDEVSAKGDVPLFLSMNIAGTVVFSSVCFDASREDSIKVYGSGVFECPDSSFGEGCECWALPSAEPQPSQSTSTASETEEPSSSQSSTATSAPVTEDPASGSGGRTNAGLIAGVVVALIVIIVIIILVVLLLLRKRSRDTGEGGAAAEEFTEETITTLTDENTTGDNGEWSQTTEDNPLFATENFDDDAFTNAFEEDGFFGE